MAPGNIRSELKMSEVKRVMLQSVDEDPGVRLTAKPIAQLLQELQ